jgi:hypothetical protein
VTTVLHYSVMAAIESSSIYSLTANEVIAVTTLVAQWAQYLYSFLSQSRTAISFLALRCLILSDAK